jgi:hypothetical protein
MRESEFHAAIANRFLPSPHIRFGVYRNNVNAALVNALGVRFPATSTLLGGEEFARRALAFALQDLPRSPVLIDYGEAFAETLQEPVSDVARLENLWWKAYHCADVEPVATDFLAAFAPEELFGLRFRFHPSLGLIRVANSAASTWSAARQGEIMAFGNAQEHVLVARPEADVHVTLLTPSSFQFISMLAEGASLGAVADALVAPGFDLAAEIAGLLKHQIIIGA